MGFLCPSCGAERRNPRPGGKARALRTRLHLAPPAASKPRSRERREGVGGGKVGPGGGCLGSRAALTSLGARFGPERFKKRACERRCCSTPSRPPAAAARTAPAAAAARAAPEARVAAGARPGPAALLLGAPAGGQERGAPRCRRPRSRRSPPSCAWRATFRRKPDAALPPRPARGPLPGHHGHLLGRLAPGLARPAPAGGRGRLAEAGRAAAWVPRALSVRAGRQDAAQGGLLRPGAFGAALQPQCLHLLPVSAPSLRSGKGAEGGKEAGPRPGWGLLGSRLLWRGRASLQRASWPGVFGPLGNARVSG